MEVSIEPAGREDFTVLCSGQISHCFQAYQSCWCSQEEILPLFTEESFYSRMQPGGFSKSSGRSVLPAGWIFRKGSSLEISPPILSAQVALLHTHTCITHTFHSSPLFHFLSLLCVTALTERQWTSDVRNCRWDLRPGCTCDVQDETITHMTR